jgi:diguanylate cyclase (GGDEF)-like protein
VLDILKSLSARRGPAEVLFTFTNQVAETLGLDRCSVVRIVIDKAEAQVLASHEDAQLRDLALDLIKYPELVECVESGRAVTILDTLTDPRTAPFAREFEQSGITSIVVVPVILFESRLGSILLRAARRGRGFTEREVQFCELVAESTANALERAYLLDDLRRANADLQRMARTDGLTGLYNRAYFRQFIDVDDFKQINDTYGHLAGDGVLQEIARRTIASTRRNDIVARYGGEEIVMLLPHTDRAGAVHQSERLLETIATRHFLSLGADVRVTVSIGVAMFDAETMRRPDDLLRAADGSLYKAKQLGKNRIVVGEQAHGA